MGEQPSAEIRHFLFYKFYRNIQIADVHGDNIFSADCKIQASGYVIEGDQGRNQRFGYVVGCFNFIT